jgi:hypothetical protein
MKPEALRLADALDLAPYSSPCTNDAAAELRRLHSVNVALLAALRWIERRCPAEFLKQEPHVIHTEAAHDAGACARAAIAKAEGK